jgi:predicted RNA-binding protein YlxR (DUF448 family)
MMLVAEETDAGPRPRAAGQERLCIASRTVRPIDEMIRFVIGPEDVVVPDLQRRLPGRGVWVTATRDLLAVAVKRNAFAKGFKRPVRASPDLVALTDQLLERAALGSLAMARKAGLIEAGFARVEFAIAQGHIAALIHAADAAPDGVRKLATAARRHLGAAVALPVVTAFSSAQLDLALGRSNVIHAALLRGAAGEAFLTRYRNLLRFRGSEPGAWTDEARGR